MKDYSLWAILILALISGCTAPAVDAAPPVVDPGVDPEAWAAVPAGPFVQGQHDHAGVVAEGYEIMVTDVTNAQYAHYLNAALAAGEIEVAEGKIRGYYPGDPFHGGDHEMEIAEGRWLYADLADPAARITFDSTAFAVRSGYANHPATLVSWFGAWGYCEAHGWRLPSDAEWEKAARGTGDRPYPWGDEFAGHAANYLDSGDPFEALFARAGGTTPVGFYNGRSYNGYRTFDAASPYGLYDMAGNVWQWTGDVREGVHYRSLRGGSHVSYPYELRIWSHNNADPAHVSPSVGFRCARNGD